MVAQARIGVLGGTGLYQMDNLKSIRTIETTTPFGKPSDVITIGELDGVLIAFLPRHGKGHRLLPSEVPVRANIYALKEMGVERLISVSAVGSLKAEIEPLHMIIPDQIIDRTRQRPSTFFGGGVVAHIAFGEPFCPDLRAKLAIATSDLGTRTHRDGAYLVMEGPAFSTRAESRMYQSWGASIIGMTASPEAKLAREAEMCFAILATATDYDSWHDVQDDVTAEIVFANLAKNVQSSQHALRRLIPLLSERRDCECEHSLQSGLVTDLASVPKETLRQLGVIVAKYNQ